MTGSITDIYLVLGRTLLCVVLGFLPMLLIHELGHLIGGITGGYRFVSLSFLTVAVHRKRNGTWEIKRSRDIPFGQCVVCPKGEGNACRCIAGGGTANIITGITAAFTGVFLGDILSNPFAKGRFVFWLLFVFGVMSVICGVQNLLPRRLERNDGGTLYEIRHYKNAKRMYNNTMRIYTELAEGIPLSQMPFTWFECFYDGSTLDADMQVLAFKRVLRNYFYYFDDIKSVTAALVNAVDEKVYSFGGRVGFDSDVYLDLFEQMSGYKDMLTAADGNSTGTDGGRSHDAMLDAMANGLTDRTSRLKRTELFAGEYVDAEAICQRINCLKGMKENGCVRENS